MGYRNIEVTARVTAKDIAAGERDSCWRCPIARALSRAIGESVHVGLFGFSDGAGGWCRTLPDEARVFQRRFDRGDFVGPLKFVVKVPEFYVSTAVLKRIKGRGGGR